MGCPLGRPILGRGAVTATVVEAPFGGIGAVSAIVAGASLARERCGDGGSPSGALGLGSGALIMLATVPLCLGAVRW